MAKRIKSFKDAVKRIESYHDHTRWMKKYFYRYAKSFAKIGLDPFKCKNCGITYTKDVPAIMEMDHVNGDCYDGRLVNLRFLCPTCHAATDTFRGRTKTIQEIYEEKMAMCIE